MSQATQAERYFLSLINEDRARNGLQPLRLETRLNDSSQAHSAWMLGNDVFSHTGKNGSSATDRIRDADFPLESSWRVAENLAYVSVDQDGSLLDEVAQLHRNLMNSPGHRANLLDPNVDYIGIGLQVGEFNGYQVLMGTQNFAATGGHLQLDVAPGVTMGTVDRPQMTAMSVADWKDDHGSLTLGQGGTAGNDHIAKGSSANTVNGGAGDDLIFGGAGNDRLMGGKGRDFLAGQNGHDRLEGHGGADILSGGQGGDSLFGGSGNDQLFGYNGHDRLFGQKGNDLLNGGVGYDVLNGGNGRDTLVGGDGNDTMTGGNGVDYFVFNGRTGSDRITDFTVGEDQILIADNLIRGDIADFVDDRMTETRDGVVITLSEGNRILVEGSDLSVQEVADDIFLF